MTNPASLQLVPPGTLRAPGPIGRLVRTALGIACLYVVGEQLVYWSWTVGAPIDTAPNRVLVLAAPLLIFNYVVNIGFSRDWGRWPLATSLTVLAGCAALAWFVDGRLNSPYLGVPLNLWLLYFYAHLGASFLLAAALGTPGCEMRAFAELFGRLSGNPAAEHHCPAGFITKLDAWENGCRES